MSICLVENAVAPFAAARIEESNIDIERILAAFNALRDRVDQVTVEGVGAWLVPIRADYFVSDLAAEMKLPVLVVALNRLGCLNHTALTVRSVAEHGFRCASVVLNDVTQIADIATTMSAEVLENIINVRLLPELTADMSELPASAGGG